MTQTDNVDNETDDIATDTYIHPLIDVDTLQHIFQFVGYGQYRFIATINHIFYNTYKIQFPRKELPNLDNSTTDTVKKQQSYYNITNIQLARLCYDEIPKVEVSIHGKSYVFHRQFAGIEPLFSNYTPGKDDHPGTLLCNAASYKGELHKLQYFYRVLGYPFGITTCSNAAKGGHLHIVKYLRKNNCKWGDTCIEAARYGHLDVLQYAHENKCPLDRPGVSIIYEAAKYGQLDTLQYAHLHGRDLDDTTIMCAAKYGHLHILEYARTNGCSWSKTICSLAASNGHLHIIQYAHANGCPWDTQTVVEAARNGHVNVLQYAHVNDCPIEYYHILAIATERKHENVLHWLKQVEFWKDNDDGFFDWQVFVESVGADHHN